MEAAVLGVLRAFSINGLFSAARATHASCSKSEILTTYACILHLASCSLEAIAVFAFFEGARHELLTVRLFVFVSISDSSISFSKSTRVANCSALCCTMSTRRIPVAALFFSLIFRLRVVRLAGCWRRIPSTPGACVHCKGSSWVGVAVSSSFSVLDDEANIFVCSGNQFHVSLVSLLRLV